MRRTWRSSTAGSRNRLSAATEQFIVGDAAPEEERETRRQLEIAEAVGAACRKLVGITFGTEDELRTGQHALKRDLDAPFEVALLTAGAEETHQPLDVGVVPCPR